jgi:hypothetical protein
MTQDPSNTPAQRSPNDTEIVATRNKAIALLDRVHANNLTPHGMPEDALTEIQLEAWELTRQAMSYEPASLAGVRAQVALLLAHHEDQGGGPEHPDIELPPLRSLLRLIPPN